MSDNKISPHSLNDLKNTTDDCLANYLRSLSFVQDNSKLDVRLAVGYVAVIIATITFVADYKLGWEATKLGTAFAVVAYAILNGVYTYWMWMVEKGLVFEGTKGSKRVSIASKTKKHDPTYYLTVTTSSSTNPLEIQCPFTTWFTSDGYFVAQPFQQWLATSVGVIGEADQKNAAKNEKEDLFVSEAELNGTPSASGADSGKGKGTKRGKKKS
ncbi:signal peptidase complex subunit spc2 [Saxophila tyrrhenica]|uniref:Signal peptidase complex subunit 2 n=1 Tax=Saxophila tyrrhenica TaxID=1690608 RepID=A0AAV9PL42_9PEZI|nr:signal peptidase complex subunit spc2 [Saxophila tyrrhenica]